MQLGLREAAKYLGVSEATARKWIKSRGLPVHEAGERLYLNALELWEWAAEQGIPVSRKLLDHARQAPDTVPPMSELLRAGGIFHDIDAPDKLSVLREFVERLPLPADQDRGSLLAVLEAREALGSTGIGDGIAIPHVRNPILLHVEQPFVTLCLLKNPVDFDAVDAQPVHALFMVVSTTVPVHLRILGQLGFLLRDETLRRMLREQAPAEAIVQRIELLEATRSTGSFAAPRLSNS
ncbi:MAG TPA: PTS sugar transporter subunit IIA [Gemmatimonadales bacterium]|nr:PTS sugar transporter subunit IIA [Gemmatimonadales bacterium]